MGAAMEAALCRSGGGGGMLVLPGKSTFLGLITFCATDFMWDNGGDVFTDNWGVPVLLGLHEEQRPVG